MYSIVHSAILNGIDAQIVDVEVDISDGMPMFEMVGSLSAEVKESKERVRIGLKNCGYSLPVKRITVNFLPADVKKRGTALDLAVAVAVLASMNVMEEVTLDDMVLVGEVTLEGKLAPVSGVLSMVLAAKEAGKHICVVPKENRHEALYVPDIQIVGAENITEVLAFINYGILGEVDKKEEVEKKQKKQIPHDFSEINGQKVLRRVCEIAISGMHNMLMIGPPGAGKSMVAKCIPTILPPMSVEEQIEISKIYSVCGMFREREGLMSERPFRSPHHTITEQGLTGGGKYPKPGEISLAHHGVLFLDELTEFKKSTLEILRQPLEDKKICISRVNGSCTFPANFVLVAAMNPCNCGYFPNLSKCRCTPQSIRQHMQKLSQPLIDRMDLCTEVSMVKYQELQTNLNQNEDSKTIRDRVCKVHQIQKERYRGRSYKYNSQIPADDILLVCNLDKEERAYMETVYENMDLTARTYHKLLRVARTIADMEQSEQIKMKHLQEAICYRGISKEYWENCL